MEKKLMEARHQGHADATCRLTDILADGPGSYSRPNFGAGETWEKNAEQVELRVQYLKGVASVLISTLQRVTNEEACLAEVQAAINKGDGTQG